MRGRRLVRYYCYAHGKLYPNSGFCCGVPGSKIRIFDCGEKKIPCDEFPATARMICDESQQVTGQEDDEFTRMWSIPDVRCCA